jgi:hypothetical protein
LMVGNVTAAVTCWVGARRAGVPWAIRDALVAPVYWAMLSIALCNAVWQLITAPYYWDKTAHRPETAQSQKANGAPVNRKTGRQGA